MMKAQRPTLRGKSNPKTQLPPSHVLEAETKKMEEKLSVLKEMMNKAAEKRELEGSQIRWKTATDKKPLRSYAKVVLEEKARLQSRNSQKPLPGNPKPSALKRPPSGNTLPTDPSLKSPEIMAFLANLKLPQYYEAFINNGFDEMEVLREITGQHLTEMKVPPGHQIKILKALKGTEERETKSSQIAKRTDLVELPLEENPEDQNTIKGQSLRDIGEKPSQANGQQVLKLAHSGSLKSSKAGKTVTFIEKSQQGHSVNGKTQPRPENLAIIKGRTATCDEGTGTSPLEGPTSRPPERNSCWNCFKLFGNEAILAHGKGFCSEKCAIDFVIANEVICAKCNKTLLKPQAIFRENLFYCSEGCLPKLEEMYREWAKELKGAEEATGKGHNSFVPEEVLKEPVDLDLVEDLKNLGTQSKEPVFLSIKEIEEKYKDFNVNKQ